MTNNIISKEIIQDNLRVRCDENNPRSMFTAPTLNPHDFYICNDKLFVWGTYKQIPTKRIIDYIHSSRGYHWIYFPKECPTSWLKHDTQNSEFVVLKQGLSAPWGFADWLRCEDNLEKAINFIERTLDYQYYTMYLGKRDA
jgi:hypothetical protein